MYEDKFDFSVAESLVQAVYKAANELSVKNEDMKVKFGRLREGFKDSGYDTFESEMEKADRAANDVVQQVQLIANRIDQYAERMHSAV